jgi:heat shock protein HtpX
MNVISFWYSDKIVLKIYKAKLASHTEYPKLNDVVKDLADRAKIKKPRVFIVPKDTPNAFATGRSQKTAVIAVTEGLLDLLDERELRGVLAHEIGHIKNKDTLIQTVAVILASAIAYIAMIARFGAIFGSRDENSASLFHILALSIVAPLAATILQLSISRSREYIADETGAKITKDPSALASALEKLESNPRKLKKGNQATASMFIINPFSSKNFMRLFSTHPPTHERIKRLRKISMKEY